MVFKTAKNAYLFSEKHKRILFLHPLLNYFSSLNEIGADIEEWAAALPDREIELPGCGRVARQDIEYYYRKYCLLKQKDYFENRPGKAVVGRKLTPEGIKGHLYNNRHIIFEVTRACNLSCKYCAYGDLYDRFGKRSSREMSFEKARILIDYMVKLWNSDLNRSHETAIRIGFYGGEPLLNFPLIKEIVEYTKSLKLKHNYFRYGITTNGLLLGRHMAYLSKNKFMTLISLDGDEKNNGYRLFPDGRSSYDPIFKNIIALKKGFPRYFDENVNFFSVLHKLNSVEEIYNFFQKQFGKKPNFSELNPVGINESKKEEFFETLNKIEDSLNCSSNRRELEKNFLTRTPKHRQLIQCIHSYSGCVFKDYNDLKFSKKSKKHQPAGSCMPLNRRLFMRADDTIFPCEHVGEQHVMGTVDKDGVFIDFEKIAEKYNGYFDRLADLCKRCFNVNPCPACVLNIDWDKQAGRCAHFINEQAFKKRLSSHMTYLEENPGLYTRMVEGVYVE